MSKLRFTLLRFPVLLTAVIIGTMLGFTNTSEPSGQYYFGSDPGAYQITVERFKRHGPEVIEKAPFQLERSTLVCRFRIEGDGSVADVSTSVTSKDGSSRYLMELEGNQYIITDLTTGVQSEGDSVPASSLIPSPKSLERADLITNLERGGLTRVSEAVWRGQNVLIYEAQGGPIVGQLSKPDPNVGFGFHVIYDLAPVSQKVGAYLDTATGIVIRTYRYAIDSSGNETLIESFEVLSIVRED